MDSSAATLREPVAKAAIRGRRRAPLGSRGATNRRLRRVLLAAALVALAPAALSYLLALTGPSNSSFGIRSVEWLRDHGAAGIVAKIESIYYSLNAPEKGGPALLALPRAGLRGAGSPSAAGAPAKVLDRPAPVAALAQPDLPGEGVWGPTLPAESTTDPPLLVTTFRSDPAEYPRLVAGVAWINTSRTSIALYPGRLEPAAQLPSRGSMDVPPSARGSLLATFNSGFKLADSHGGWALDGHTYAPMADGQGTFVRYADGRYDVLTWHGGRRAGRAIAFARQNLPLILEGRHLSPRLSDGQEWGATVGNAVRVWRSGIGIDAHGNLLYAAGDYQTVSSLARILQHAGAVRAMELDINSYWISFNTYAAAGGLQPAKLLAGTERPSSRYLSPDDRDFFAVFRR
jgi:hypothetical protein